LFSSALMIVIDWTTLICISIWMRLYSWQ